MDTTVWPAFLPALPFHGADGPYGLDGLRFALLLEFLRALAAASLRGGAAVDDQAGTGHEAGIVRGEK